MALTNKVEQFSIDADLMHQVVHGDNATTVTTEGGPVKSVAKLQKDMQDQAMNEASGYVSQAAAQVAAAQSERLQAAGFKDQALAAWAASTYPTESIAAISRVTHTSASIVAQCLYDTRKDSDPNWIKRCAGTSWYNEAICAGIYLFEAANEAGARAKTGATTGCYYHNTTDGKYYSLNVTSGQTEVFRGNTRQFPAVSLIVAETARVIIYDALTGAMWMVFNPSGINAIGTASALLHVTSINGILYVGSNGGFLHVVNFMRDIAYRHGLDSTTTTALKGNLAQRNSGVGRVPYPVANLPVSIINAVACTILPDAPTDPVTGLQIPTVAVASGGGMSVIKQDGTVVNGSSTANSYSSVYVDDSTKRLYSSNSTNGDVYSYGAIAGLGASFTGEVYTCGTGIPAVLSAITEATRVVARNSLVAHGATLGLGLLKENPTVRAKGMVAYITNAIPGMWQMGDSRMATLADTVAETVTGVTVLSDTFDYADVAAMTAAGWTVTVGGTSTVTLNTGRVEMVSDGTNLALISKAFTTVAGKTYTVSHGRNNSGITLTRYVGTAVNGGQIANTGTTLVSDTFTFIATGTTTYITFGRTGGAGLLVAVDDLTIKLATPDRSVKNTGLVVNGSLTKAAVASGAQLVGYSGFSATNYLEQPYNSNLDFGTGDFCVMGWVKPSAVPSFEWAFYRGDDSATSTSFDAVSIGAADFRMRLNAGGASNGNTAMTIPPIVSTWNLAIMVRISGVVYRYMNGVFSDSFASVLNITKSDAVCMLGARRAGAGVTGQYLGSLALWRISATVPSADQIAYIYNTEKKLFEPNAKCTLDGTSSAVTAMDFDPITDLLHVGTSWGRSSFKDLVRVESEATTVGAINSIRAYDGQLVQSGASAAKIYIPAKSLREELNRRAEQAAAFGRPLVPQEFDATASQTDFVLPLGFTPKFVYVAGALKRMGATKDFTLVDDGFRVTVKFNAGQSLNAWVSVLCERVK